MLQNAVGKMRSLALVLTSFNLLQVVVRCQELSVIRHSDGDIFTIEGKYIRYCFAIMTFLSFFFFFVVWIYGKGNSGRRSKVSRWKCRTYKYFLQTGFSTRASRFSLEALISTRDFLAMGCGNDDVMTRCVSVVRFEKRATRKARFAPVICRRIPLWVIFRYAEAKRFEIAERVPGRFCAKSWHDRCAK